MLAQNFKTPAALRIKDAEFKALLKVLGMLERGEIVAMPKTANFLGKVSYNTPLCGFAMATSRHDTECGTVGCILGWVCFIAEDQNLFRDATLRSHSAHELFYPSGPAITLRRTEPAAIAVRNYLTFGEPRWAEALAE
jgi:hypothetical protein